MPKKDPRVDAYIARSAEFARPILTRLRKLIHAACPAVTETMKWQVPFYEHKGIICGTPAFKHHCALVFWKSRLILGKGGAGQFRRITSLGDLPGDKILTGYIKKSVALNEAGVKAPALSKAKVAKKIVVPDYFLAALKKDKKALATFEKLSPSCRREYVEWITEAKRDETRAKRLETAIGWMAKGKSRN